MNPHTITFGKFSARLENSTFQKLFVSPNSENNYVSVTIFMYVLLILRKKKRLKLLRALLTVE